MLNVPPQNTAPMAGPPTSRPWTPPTPPPERRRNRAIGWLIGGLVGVVLLISLFALLLASAAGWMFSGSAGTRFTDTTTQTFTVTAPAALTIQNPAGNVTIRQGDGNQVSVRVTKVVRTFNQSVATRELSRMVVDTKQNGNTVQVQSNYSTSFFDGMRSSRSVDLLVTAPQETAVTLRLNAGNATVADLHGKMDLQLNAGNLEASGVQVSDGSTLSADAGNITANVSMTPAATLSVKVSTGKATLTLPANTPARLDARVNVGSITVTGWPISVSHPTPPSATASGPLGDAATGQVQAQVQVGSISVMSR